MKYALLIYTDENHEAKLNPAEMQKMMGGYFAFTESIKKGGQYIGGEALQPTATATTVQVVNGQTLTTDGPFAETKEQLGGFYLVDCKDLDEATSLAAQIPGAAIGRIEVRPIMVFG